MARPALTLWNSATAACPRCGSRPFSTSLTRASRNGSLSRSTPSNASPRMSTSPLALYKPLLQARSRPAAMPAPVRTLTMSMPARAATPVADPASQITAERYHELADEYLDEVDSQFSDKAELDPNYEIEFSAGVLTVSIEGQGTYVINKQPPNKQIWLSSPISGPKRYDFVDGRWIYSRDGRSLSELLKEETGVDLPDRQD